MVMYNWRTACKRNGVDVTTLKSMARDNIVAPGTINALNVHMGGATTKIFQRGDPGFNAIAQTPHDKNPRRILKDYEAELGRKRVEAYEITRDGDYYNMIIDIRNSKRVNSECPNTLHARSRFGNRGVTVAIAFSWKAGGGLGLRYNGSSLWAWFFVYALSRIHLRSR
ncbi:hypothetical protein K458DRAFT_422399 [Lentithecium fluviatile CBS 122367]|uniref:Uncharacterized protein n=1 Tax=Lentithecium fluviatile CBS 122367 TaxID=1168545 RepID=A0A6G1IMP6_9PLEO|nr:hypothetical protein K458DRAFT_422399 [Lentithecium fluviatile CBS 122367]